MNSEVVLLNQYWTDIYYHLHYQHKEKISHQAIRILQLVDKQEKLGVNIGVNEIASYIQVSHNTASEHVKRLIDKNYLIKSRAPNDERKVVLCLTNTGEDVLRRNTSLDEEKLEQVLNQLEDSEKILVEQALKILSEHAKQCI